MRADAGGTRTGVTVRPRPHGSSLRRRETVPWPIPGPRQERPCAGRSPGSRVIARCTAFPDRTDPVAASSKEASASRSPLTVAGTAADLDGRPSAPHSHIKPLAGHRRDHSNTGFLPVPDRAPTPKSRRCQRGMGLFEQRATGRSTQLLMPGVCPRERLTCPSCEVRYDSAIKIGGRAMPGNAYSLERPC